MSFSFFFYNFFFNLVINLNLLRHINCTAVTHLLWVIFSLKLMILILFVLKNSFIFECRYVVVVCCDPLLVLIVLICLNIYFC